MGAPEQHFLRPDRAIGLVGADALAGRDVVEFGAGRGALSRLLLDAGARSVEAWEIDLALASPLPDPRLRWRTADIRAARPADVTGRAVAAFPPYSLLPFLLDLCRNAPDLLLMVPPRHADACAALGMATLAELDGTAFEPVSTGRHLVVGRGAFAP